MSIPTTLIPISWYDGKPVAPNVEVEEKGDVLILWAIEPGSGIEYFEIEDLNEKVFTGQASEMDGTLFTATDHNLEITSGPHDYTIKAKHRDGYTGRHDPRITNNPT